MKKEEIFPLYVGKCKVKVNNEITDFTGYVLSVKEYNIVYCRNSKNGWAYASDCQLVLKRISGMSDADFSKLIKELDIRSEADIEAMQEFLMVTNARAVFNLTEMNSLNEWLRNNRYALSDDWFKSQNGQPPIAVEEN